MRRLFHAVLSLDVQHSRRSLSLLPILAGRCATASIHREKASRASDPGPSRLTVVLCPRARFRGVSETPNDHSECAFFAVVPHPERLYEIQDWELPSTCYDYRMTL